MNDSATTEDRLGYDVYRDAIVTFLQDPNTKPPLTIGIKGKWGTGKTSLMHMVRSKVDPPDATEGASLNLRPIPLLDTSQQRLSSYAGKGRPGVGEGTEPASRAAEDSRPRCRRRQRCPDDGTAGTLSGRHRRRLASHGVVQPVDVPDR